MELIKRISLLLILAFITSCAPVKVACVGDSITYGSSIKHRDSLAYPAQLQRLLGKKYTVLNFGHSGATMLKKGDKPYWNLPEYQKTLDFEPEIIVLMLGTNDTKSKNWDAYQKEFLNDYKKMIYSFQKLKTSPKIYIGLPPPVIRENWGIRKKIVEGVLIERLLEIAKNYSLKTIDLQSIFKNRNHLFPDGIHPNGAGAALIAVKIYKTIKN